MTRPNNTPKSTPNGRIKTPDPKACRKCGQPHDKCTAHNRTGQPCGQHPIRGGKVCKTHGGRAPQTRRKAEKRVAQAAAEAAVARFGLRRDVAPADALLEEVARSAGMVDWYEQEIRRLEPDKDPNVLTWGLSKRVRKGSGEFPGTDETWSAEAIVLVDLWMRERRHLSEVSAAAVRADAELHASQAGALVVQVMWPPAGAGGGAVPVIVTPPGGVLRDGGTP